MTRLNHDRDHDLVLFGATGYCGGLAAVHLARNAPDRLRWALAGRDRAKLESRRAELAKINPRCADLPLLHADLRRPDSIRVVAEGSRVVITTVGPYTTFGEPLVAACARAGTDYVDLTGEPEFVDRMYLRYHDQAVATGARLVHSCGFESAVHDLGVYHTVHRLPAGEPITVDGYQAAVASMSGGSLQTLLTSFARLRPTIRAERERRQAERRSDLRMVTSTAGRPRWVPQLDAWAMPMPTLGPKIVGRTAHALDRYGPDFRYRHFTIKHPLPAAGMAAGLLVVFAAVHLPPVRRLLGRLIAPGTGPSQAQRARRWFRVTFVGTAGGQQVRAEISGGDPGYDASPKILAEAGLCLALDELPACRGQVTPAVAMGDKLLARLPAAGIELRSGDRSGSERRPRV